MEDEKRSPSQRPRRQIEYRLILGLDRLTNIISRGWARSPAELARIDSRLAVRQIADDWQSKSFKNYRRFIAYLKAHNREIYLEWNGQRAAFMGSICAGLSMMEVKLKIAGYSQEWIDGS